MTRKFVKRSKFLDIFAMKQVRFLNPAGTPHLLSARSVCWTLWYATTFNSLVELGLVIFRLFFAIEGGERGRRPPLPEIVRSSYRRLQ